MKFTNTTLIALLITFIIWAPFLTAFVPILGKTTRVLRVPCEAAITQGLGLGKDSPKLSIVTGAFCISSSIDISMPIIQKLLERNKQIPLITYDEREQSYERNSFGNTLNIYGGTLVFIITFTIIYALVNTLIRFWFFLRKKFSIKKSFVIMTTLVLVLNSIFTILSILIALSSRLG